jgi:hypothetical protein
MSLITVLYEIKSQPVREKIQRELLWHDDLRGELLTFHGGQLDFEYKEDEYLVAMGAEERQRRGITTTYRMIPKVKDLEVVNYNKIKTITNEKEVKKWMDDYINYNINDISIVAFDNDGLVVDVPEDEVEDFLYQTERKGLRTRRE